MLDQLSEHTERDLMRLFASNRKTRWAADSVKHFRRDPSSAESTPKASPLASASNQPEISRRMEEETLNDSLIKLVIMGRDQNEIIFFGRVTEEARLKVVIDPPDLCWKSIRMNPLCALIKDGDLPTEE